MQEAEKGEGFFFFLTFYPWHWHYIYRKFQEEILYQKKKICFYHCIVSPQHTDLY